VLAKPRQLIVKLSRIVAGKLRDAQRRARARRPGHYTPPETEDLDGHPVAASSAENVAAPRKASRGSRAPSEARKHTPPVAAEVRRNAEPVRPR